MKETFQNVQALRGIACLVVVVYHLAGYEGLLGIGFNPIWPARWFGYAGVDLFFVISGFIIARSNERIMGNPSEVPGYLFRRFWRVVPPYWIWLLCFAVPVDLYGQYRTWNSETIEPFLRAVFLIPAYQLQIWIPQAWTLWYELAFYTAFAVVIALPRRISTALVIAWATLLVFHRIVQLPTPTAWSDLWFGPYVIEFLLGVLIAKSFHRVGMHLATILFGISALWWIISFVATIRLDQPGFPPGQDLIRVFVFGIPEACLVLLFVVAERSGRVVKNRFLLATGDASYSLYLTHITVFLVGYRLTSELGWHHSRFLHIVWISLFLTASLIVGFAYHRNVELPLQNWIKAKRRPREAELQCVCAFSWRVTVE